MYSWYRPQEKTVREVPPMCLINFQLHEHPTYKLIVVANRDEFYSRPTAPANFWKSHPNLLAGRDLLGMGTWLGVTMQGKFAALTNFRGDTEQSLIDNKITRGEIVKNYLIEDVTPEDYLEKIHFNKDKYEGFNVIVGHVDQLFYYNNIEMEIKAIPDGTYGLSNHMLNTPWPKVTTSKQRFKQYIKNHDVIGANDLFDIFSDRTLATDDLLPQTGIGIDLERVLSPLFIKTPDYGTRSSTVLFVDHDNYLTFVERTYQNGEFVRDTRHSFRITAS